MFDQTKSKLAEGPNALVVRDLVSGYGRVKILDAANFTVAPKEIVAILGRNGAGKTTLLKTIMGLIRPWSGEITVEEGKQLTGKSAARIARSGIGYVPQGRGIFPGLTVRENLSVPLSAQRKPAARLDEVIEMFPALKAHLNRRGGGLSGGQQQILALARALIGEPRILLLDEPSEGIQPSILDEITDILNRLVDRENLSVLLVEQNIDFAADLANRAYIMELGRIVRSLERAELDANTLSRELMTST